MMVGLCKFSLHVLFIIPTYGRITSDQGGITKVGNGYIRYAVYSVQFTCPFHYHDIWQNDFRPNRDHEDGEWLDSVRCLLL